MRKLLKKLAKRTRLWKSINNIRERLDYISIQVDELQDKVDPLFYHDFEECFRGSQDEIRSRLRKYTQVLTEQLNLLSDKVFVDIGCGRGEWLDILKENGVSNYIGIDINSVQIALCVEKGHKVQNTDCIKYLSTCDINSIDVITGFHIIEHLSLSALIELLESCEKVLKPGGVILLETPNSRNLQTAASYFYIDPTHKRPMHMEFSRFLLTRSGFKSISVIQSAPMSKENHLQPPIMGDNLQLWESNIDKLNSLLFSNQDYAIMGIK